MKRTIKAENLAGVYTHTHTINLVKINSKVNIIKDNIGLSSIYYDTG